MPTFKIPAISSIFRIIGSLALACILAAFALWLSTNQEDRHASELLFALPTFGVVLLLFTFAKIIDCLALIAHNTAPKATAATVGTA
jgi:hypothetical protein